MTEQERRVKAIQKKLDRLNEAFLWRSGRAGRRHAPVGVRTFERAGVPRSVAMSIVGHKTESIYRRYAIVDEAMQREAAARLDAFTP
jgi:hypothetical protein